MSRERRRMPGGLYLVVDPAEGIDNVLPKVEAALRGGVSVLQVWNHWRPGQDARAFVGETLAVARPRGVPVLVHEDLELLRATCCEGIHYDTPAHAPAEVRALLARDDVVYGVTCGNDLERVRWAAEQGADYVSFCSMYASPSAGACEIVSLETVAAARAPRDAQALGNRGLRIFASGGITPDNARAVLDAGADGLAVISGILAAADPAAAAERYARVIEEARHARPSA